MERKILAIQGILDNARERAADFFCGIRFGLKSRIMNRICQHCDEIIIGNAYHVTSEEEGIALLDMIVCSLCAAEAKSLQLHTEQITSESMEALSLYERLRRPRVSV
jgi:superfamily II helicase